MECWQAIVLPLGGGGVVIHIFIYMTVNIKSVKICINQKIFE